VPSTPISDLLEILRVLTEHRVRFILVGGVSAAIQGAPILTLDLDVVHSRDPKNIDRLLRALESLDAHYRTSPERRIKPGVSHLSSSGHQLLTTRLGPLDILGMIGLGRQYDDLLPHTVEMEIGDGVRVAALDLETLILVKEETAGEKDRAMLPVLRRTLEEKSRQRN
jgi:hypothetical protein